MASTRPYANPRKNLADTAASVELLWPLIATDYGGGTITSLEDSEELHVLDADAGIDFVQHDPMRHVRTWASRFQWGPVWYGSFSIRYERPTGRPTEYAKRMSALHHGYTMPDYTLQGYLDARPPGGLPIAAGIVDTRALYGFLDSERFRQGAESWASAKRFRVRGSRRDAQPLPWWGYRTLRDGTRFLFVTWELLRYVGIPITIYQWRDRQGEFWDPVAVSL